VECTLCPTAADCTRDIKPQMYDIGRDLNLPGSRDIRGHVNIPFAIFPTGAALELTLYLQGISRY